jgi:hypothetical protein
MAKLDSFDNLFKFKKTLLEDDYFDKNEYLIIKHSSKSADEKYVLEFYLN